VKYLLSCCQHPDGGLRDKPPMRSDFYHTQYSLAGLSAAQYYYLYDSTVSTAHLGIDGSDEPAFKWIVKGAVEPENADNVETVHPVFVLPWGHAEGIRSYFEKKESIRAT